MRRWSIGLMACLALLAGIGAARAGPSHTVGRKALCAQSAVEVELKFDGRPPPPPGRRHGKFPDDVRRRALDTARVVKVLFATGPAVLPKPLEFYLNDRVWWAAQRKGSMRAILFVRPFGNELRVFYGVEGVPSDAAPGYEQVRAALLQFAQWRKGENDGAAVAEAEKLLTRAPNHDVAALAHDYPCSKNDIQAIERAWSAADAGSAAAAQRDWTRSRSYPVCSKESDDCSAW